jgi:hypothetical protein
MDGGQAQIIERGVLTAPDEAWDVGGGTPGGGDRSAGRRAAGWVQLALEAALQNKSHQESHQDFRRKPNDLLGQIRSASKPGDVIHDSAVPSRPPA